MIDSIQLRSIILLTGNIAVKVEIVKVTSFSAGVEGARDGIKPLRPRFATSEPIDASEEESKG